MRWFYRDPLIGWSVSDVIPLQTMGGRPEGFRGFAKKARLQPGDWRVEVETEDGREIGRIHFTVVPDPEPGEPRELMEILG